MRAYLPVLVSVLLGAVVGGVLFLLPVARQAAQPSRAAPQAVPQTPRPALTPTPPPAAAPTLGPANPAAPPANPTPPPLALSSPVLDGAGGDLAADALAAARALVAAGRLREAQDEYIQALLVAPDSEVAMRELVALRRHLAGGDPALLRSQAAAYRRAIARGEETEEHYTVPAMRILAQACVLAALQIEQGAPPSSPLGIGRTPIVLESTPVSPTVNPTQPSAARVTPRPRRTPRPTPRAAPVTARPATPTPTPAPTPSPRPTVEATLDVNEPFLIVTIGPFYTATRASEVAGELTIAGYAAHVTRPGGGTTYLITLGPYRRSVTIAIMNLVRSRFPGTPVSVAAAPP